ncbi:MAG: shikimate dehydrogenase [Fimbriimonadaceae bacterium]|nr:shikimate dehydrogenase [Fimbriimonadaceae bacterium]
MTEIWGTTQVVGVIGHPVRHSFSPPMQNAALAALGLDWVYVPFDSAPADLPTALAGLRAAGVVGLNATIPHKQALLPLVTVATAEAQLTGTVNTVHFDGDQIVGDSTDGPGFVTGLAAAGITVEGRRVVLLGAGGSARAVGVALVKAGAERVLIANRTVPRAAELAALLNGLAPGVANASDLHRLDPELAGAELIVNTTAVGMHPDSHAQPVSLPALRSHCAVVDIIYNPARTRLLQEAALQGVKTLNGVPMLVHQGALSLQRWTGCAPPVALMQQVLERELAKRAAG